MPHSSLKIIPGVDQNKTPALNEAAVSESQLIRFIPDRTLGGLVQKLGGWTKYFPNTIGSIIRNLWAWEDTNANSYLGVGAEGIAVGGGQTLNVIVSGAQNDITPQTTVVDIAVAFSTIAGSNEVTVTDTGRQADPYDAIDIKTQISVGGLVLFGQYPVYNSSASANQYEIYAKDVLGDPQYATSTVSGGGATAVYDTTSGSNIVTVTLADHGLAAGENFPVLIATLVGGVTLYGNYTVRGVTSSSQFTIAGSTEATATASGSENGGDLYAIFYNGIGPIPAGTGFGTGPYGGGAYGSGIPPIAGTGTPINATDWTLDNWGDTLIACPTNGPIYQWSPPNGDPVALIIPNAPPVNDGMFVAMPQRQIVAWGSTFTGVKDPLLIRWCDVDNYNSWIALVINQAGSYRIPKGSRIVQCIQGPQQGLIWTDIGVWAMQYVGPPYVYQFNEIGNGCGLIGTKAAGSMGGAVYWMGPSQFYRLSGNGVEPLRCPVWDVVFQELDTDNLDKIRFAANSRFGEIMWFFPTTSNGGENYGYLKYNTVIDQWDYGFNTDDNPYVSRTAWINESVLGPPIGAALNQYIYQHETSQNADTLPMVSSFQTGYFAVNEADVKVFIDQVWPDMKWGYFGGTQGANVNITFYGADYPSDTPVEYGPYIMTAGTKFITPRIRARLLSIKLESTNIDTFWRLGNIRYRSQIDGKY
tara:strand:+ start:3376 stop:5469 length:2094 start_codon:yes stop_codon:yes gene_type:complete